MKFAEQLSHEDVTSQTSEELTRRLEPRGESELESVKEVTQRVRQMGRLIQKQTSCRVWNQRLMNFEILTRSAMSLKIP